MQESALVIMVGVTANRAKRARLDEFFAQSGDYDVYVPALPQRLGLNYCVRWFQRYVSQTIVPPRYQRVDYLNYISGGLIFRHAVRTLGSTNTGRLVFVRGPVQEMVPAALVAKYGKLLSWLIFGKMVLDLSSADLATPPLPEAFQDRGLITEHGVSGLARALRLTADSLPSEAWQPTRLLPGATDWRSVPQSHDDVYTSASVLSLVLSFLRHGRFPKNADREAS